MHAEVDARLKIHSTISVFLVDCLDATFLTKKGCLIFELLNILNFCIDSMKERGTHVEELMIVLSVEMKAVKVREKEAFQRRDRCKAKVEQLECLVESY